MKICISIILALTFCVTLFAQTAIESDYDVYRDEQYSFSLFYPKDWTQLQPSHAQTRFKVTKEDGLYYTDFSINAIYLENSKNISANEMVKAFSSNPKIVESLIKQGNPTAKLISSGKTYLSNREAFFIISNATYRTLDQEKEVTVYQIMTRHQGITFTLTFRSLTKEFEENLPTFKFIASSFSILPTQIITPPKANTSGKTSEITYEKVNLNGIGSILIPSNMEIQAGIYKELSDQMSKELDSDVTGQIIFQQAGRNNTLKTSDTYARLMLAKIPGEPGEFDKITSRIVLTKQELTLINKHLKTEVENGLIQSNVGLKILRWDGTSVVTVNGRSAMKVAYLRQLQTNPPVYVEMYMIQNYDVMYRLTISYRMEDSEIWQKPLEKVKSSFTVTNVRP